MGAPNRPPRVAKTTELRGGGLPGRCGALRNAWAKYVHQIELLVPLRSPLGGRAFDADACQRGTVYFLSLDGYAAGRGREGLFLPLRQYCL